MGFVQDGKLNNDLFIVCENHENLDFYNGLDISQYQDYEQFFFEIPIKDIPLALHNLYISCMQQEKNDTELIVKSYLIEDYCFGCSDINPKDVFAWKQ